VVLVAVAPVPATTSSIDVFTGVEAVGFDVGDADSPTSDCLLVSMPTSTLISKTTRTTRIMRMAFLFFMTYSC